MKDLSQHHAGPKDINYYLSCLLQLEVLVFWLSCRSLCQNVWIRQSRGFYVQNWTNIDWVWKTGLAVWEGFLKYPCTGLCCKLLQNIRMNILHVCVFLKEHVSHRSGHRKVRVGQAELWFVEDIINTLQTRRFRQSNPFLGNLLWR